MPIAAGDDPTETAEDFCRAYRKGPRAKKLLVEAIRASVVHLADESGDEWVEVEGPREVEIDLSRV